MALNNSRPHLYVIPEDDANRQLANGFLMHDQVAQRVVQVMQPAKGWKKVFAVCKGEYIPLLETYQHCHVVLLIDFDEVETRAQDFFHTIPEHVRSRLYVIGSWDEPEVLRSELQSTFEAIGRDLAEACFDDNFSLWEHEHLKHNQSELERLKAQVRSILFPSFSAP